MRHRFAGRKFGRNPKHQRALMRMLAVSLILTERDEDAYFDPKQAPKVKGRIITTIQKAKEVRPFVEKCVTIAKNALPAKAEADKLYPGFSNRRDPQYKAWRQSADWQAWNKANAPVVAARRRLAQLLHDETAVKLLFDVIAPLYTERQGGYTRILRLAKPRLGDAGTRAILEFVKNDKKAEAVKPNFDAE
ncbi:MAG: L17 family ribosomal protein [Planctomycetia bacterium]|nr:L17 family ribosomal protein [Planctomycetia bacterium]